jgi:hypothetical protein
MNCLSIEQVYLYLENALSASEKRGVEQHLASCEKCKNAFEERKLLQRAAESLLFWSTPAGFTRQVMDRIFPARVPLLSWVGAVSASLASIVLAFTAWILATGQNLADVLLGINHTLLNYVKNLLPLLVKIFKLTALGLKVFHQFSQYLFKLIAWMTTLVSPQVQVIILAATAILITFFIFGMRRKILLGEKT